MIEIGSCGYFYHGHKFSDLHKSGLQDYLFRLQTEGIARVTVNGHEATLEKGHLLLLRPGDSYELRIDEGDNSGDLYLFCRGTWIDDWWDRSTKPSLYRLDFDERILALWRHIIAEDRRPSSQANDELIDYLIKALCVTFELAVSETSPFFNRPPIVTRMMRYIEENALSPLKIADVAQHVGLSTSRAVSLFKKHTGKTIIEYALEIRLSYAVELMNYTAATLDKIAEKCGFNNYAYFNKAFKKKYGKTPGQLRREE
ncbi:helix-turn-helix domain-containing protein [Alicyclobacillus acidiphilus]|uniref:helix-turn-helix domain-containing protein n=1 Tax=Alicyclobacillus acidiphilus TaxID=182455 RepID=UPI00083645D0|nr:AraC family transcriptional regulator [Alicyclobacillus acidiphilus]